MSSGSVLGLGSQKNEGLNLRARLESAVGRVTVTGVSGDREALTVLAAHPQPFLIVIIPTRFVEEEHGSLITGVKQAIPLSENVHAS